MTDEEFTELVWFYLLDADFTGVKYLAVDFDGEIVFGIDLVLTQVYDDNNNVLWRGGEYVLSNIYIPFIDGKIPENYRTVMITV